MSKSFGRSITISFAKVIVALMVAGITLTIVWYLASDAPKLEALLAGLASGFAIALVQYLIEWHEHTEVDAIKRMGIRGISAHRDNKEFYAGLISSAKREILVLGNTASRFMEDFAHRERADSRALMQAVERGVAVRILLPNRGKLPSHDRQRADQSIKRMGELQSQFPQQFQCRMFDHAPMHSLVKVDDSCLIGPIFPHVRSKDTPTIHVSANSAFVVEYLTYFEKEWEKAERPKDV